LFFSGSDITAGKPADALKGIEEATGKVNIVLARNPELALIPGSVEALIIDVAPRDIDDIEKLADAWTRQSCWTIFRLHVRCSAL
jgi:hypothetical protein